MVHERGSKMSGSPHFPRCSRGFTIVILQQSPEPVLATNLSDRLVMATGHGRLVFEDAGP